MSQVDVGVADEPGPSGRESHEADALIKALPQFVDEINQAGNSEKKSGLTLTIGVDAEVIQLLVAEIRALSDDVRALRAVVDGQSLEVKKSHDLLDRVIDGGDSVCTNTGAGT